MNFLTNEKLTIVGAAGMIGSNMAQTAMMMKGEWKKGELPERWDGRTAERIVQILTSK